MPGSFVALGGNEGNVPDTFHEALDRLESDPALTVRQISRVYRSSPVGCRSRAEFCNAVADVETSLEPLALLDLLQTVEAEFGRTRELHWGPRPLDLDLILYGNRIIDHPRLQVPHPACWYRRFVLDPMIEIAGAVVHPDRQITFQELRTRMLARPLPVALVGASAEMRNELIDSLSKEFPEAELFHWGATVSTQRESAILIWLGSTNNFANAQQLTFDALPVSSRLDALATREDTLTFLRHVLQSALQPPAAEDAVNQP